MAGDLYTAKDPILDAWCISLLSNWCTLILVKAALSTGLSRESCQVSLVRSSLSAIQNPMSGIQTSSGFGWVLISPFKQIRNELIAVLLKLLPIEIFLILSPIQYFTRQVLGGYQWPIPNRRRSILRKNSSIIMRYRLSFRYRSSTSESILGLSFTSMTTTLSPDCLRSTP